VPVVLVPLAVVVLHAGKSTATAMAQRNVRASARFRRFCLVPNPSAIRASPGSGSHNP
jgi:hypothetical protein